MDKKLEMRRAKLINNIIAKSMKKFEADTTMLLSSKDVTSVVKRTISTGSPDLDRILAKDNMDRFGVPVGRIVGVSGKEASGKTTILSIIMRNVQKIGGVAALIETEHAFDPSYAEKLGVDIDELLISQPRYLEEGLDLVEFFIDMFEEAKLEHLSETKEEWDVPMVIGFDSIAGVPPKAEWESGSYEDEQALGLHARKLSKFFRKISGKISREQICLICTNQLKTDTGVKWGNKDTEIGGKALKFHASLRIDVRQASLIRLTKDGDPIGIEVTAKTVKNKVMLPFKSVTIPILFGVGIDYPTSLFRALLNTKIIKKD